MSGEWISTSLNSDANSDRDQCDISSRLKTLTTPGGQAFSCFSHSVHVAGISTARFASERINVCFHALKDLKSLKHSTYTFFAFLVLICLEALSNQPSKPASHMKKDRCCSVYVVSTVGKLT